MPSIQRHPRPCLLCSFNIAEWLAPSLATAGPSNLRMWRRAKFSTSPNLLRLEVLEHEARSGVRKLTIINSISQPPPNSRTGVLCNSKEHSEAFPITLGTKRLRLNRPLPEIPSLCQSMSIESARSGPQNSTLDRHNAVVGPGARTSSKVAEGVKKLGMEVTFEERSRGSKSLLADAGYVLEGVVWQQFNNLIDKLKWTSKNHIGKLTCKAWGINSEEDMLLKADEYKAEILRALNKSKKGVIDKNRNLLFYRLRRSFVQNGLKGVWSELKLRFSVHVIGFEPDTVDIENQKKLGDFRFPLEWFPATRELQRTIHLHVGPTNSGKTYHALQRLEAAKTGIYAGPLRLLAHEVYTRMNAKGKKCSLITGEERRVPEGMTDLMSSCTVEMVPLHVRVEVAVIDEIQMMSDPERGFAWTTAFLGVQADEVHLCGELRTVDLITELCTLMGDKLVVHRYERLSQLKMQPRCVGMLSNLEKGDAVILFSRSDIHSMKKKIEIETGKRCAVVYGSLPPETRAQQAALFNDPDNDYDFLAASDAIGMGLNLSIRRVIFETAAKHDGFSFRNLETSEIKQIAGRAGRYKTARDAVTKGAQNLADGVPGDVELSLQVSPPQPSCGYVTSLRQEDLWWVKQAMEDEAPPIKKCGVLPPDRVVERFASYFPPGTPFSYILLRLNEVASTSRRFFLSSIQDHLAISDALHGINLTIRDRLIFTKSPTAISDPVFILFLQEMARCVADQADGHILNMKHLDLDLLNMGAETYQDEIGGYLKRVESLHKAVTTYLWLSYRFEDVFNSQALAFHIRDLIEAKINDCLDRVGHKGFRRSKKARGLWLKEQAKEKETRAQLDFDEETELDEIPSDGGMPKFQKFGFKRIQLT